MRLRSADVFAASYPGLGTLPAASLLSTIQGAGGGFVAKAWWTAKRRSTANAQAPRDGKLTCRPLADHGRQRVFSNGCQTAPFGLFNGVISPKPAGASTS